MQTEDRARPASGRGKNRTNRNQITTKVSENMFDRFLRSDDHESMNKALDLLKPQLDHFAAEKDAARVNQQRVLQPQLEKIRRQREAEIPPLQAEVQELSEKEEKLRAALKATEKARSRAASDLAIRSSGFDHQENLVGAAIRDLASPVIAERQRAWSALIDEARLKVQTEERSTGPNMFGISYRIFSSNISGLQQRIDVITQAIKLAEQLKMQPLSEGEVIKKLDVLEEKFPPLVIQSETVRFPAPDVSELRRATW
jgi:hypothetical protein